MDGTPHRFRLERIRHLRERSEDLAKQALADSLNLERAAEERVAQAAATITAARQALAQTTAAPTDASAMLARQAYLERTETVHRASLETLKGHARAVDASRGRLIEAARARQSLDRLHDRSLAAHAAESSRRERATLDEIALNSFRRRAAA
jgi:flagellar export protein FliJ